MMSMMVMIVVDEDDHYLQYYKYNAEDSVVWTFDWF